MPDEAAARRERRAIAAALAQILGEPVLSFAFPYGEPGVAFTPAQVALAREGGFDIVLSTQPGFLSPGEAAPWPRIGVDRDATPESLLDELASVHRETSGWPAVTEAGPTLGERVRQVVRQCVKRGVHESRSTGAGNTRPGCCNPRRSGRCGAGHRG